MNINIFVTTVGLQRNILLSIFLYRRARMVHVEHARRYGLTEKFYYDEVISLNIPLSAEHDACYT